MCPKNSLKEKKIEGANLEFFFSFWKDVGQPILTMDKGYPRRLS